MSWNLVMWVLVILYAYLFVVGPVLFRLFTYTRKVVKR